MIDPTPLEKAFAFTAEQLALNRQGIVAPDQLRDQGIFALLVLPMLSLGLGLWAWFGKEFPDRFGREIGKLASPIFRVFLAAAALVLAIHAGRAIHAYLRPGVDMVEGLVTAVRNNPKGPASLVIEGLSLNCGAAYPKAREVIDFTTVYRAYYLRGSDRLLSIEPSPR